MRYYMHISLFTTMSLNYFVDNRRNILNIALMFDFDVLFVYSFVNKTRYYIVTSSIDDSKTQSKNAK